MNTPENTDRDSVESTALFDAVARLQGLADRWNETPEWHNPPFLDGRIHITTGDLRDISTVCREIRASNDKLCHEALRIGSSAVFSDVGEKSSNKDLHNVA